MINALINGVFKIIISLSSIILAPIDLLIRTFIPDLNYAIGAIAKFFTYALTYIGYVVDMTLLSSEIIQFVILAYVFRLTVPFAIYSVKLAIKWYNSLKL